MVTALIICNELNSKSKCVHYLFVSENISANIQQNILSNIYWKSKYRRSFIETNSITSVSISSQVTRALTNMKSKNKTNDEFTFCNEIYSHQLLSSIFTAKKKSLSNVLDRIHAVLLWEMCCNLLSRFDDAKTIIPHPIINDGLVHDPQAIQVASLEYSIESLDHLDQWVPVWYSLWRHRIDYLNRQE